MDPMENGDNLATGFEQFATQFAGALLADVNEGFEEAFSIFSALTGLGNGALGVEGDGSATEDTVEANPLDDALSLLQGTEGIGSFSDNFVGNNGAILLTDNAQSTVNFLYVNPIEFFNNGRASDIYINISPENPAAGDELPGSGGAAADRMPQTGDGREITDNVVSNNAAILLTDEAESEVNFLYVNPIEFFNNGRASDIYLNLEYGIEVATEAVRQHLGHVGIATEAAAMAAADNFGFAEAGTAGTAVEEENATAEIDGNVIGNNAAILLTDNAQSVVNFLYINPIQFFNDGRGGDIYLDFTLGQDDGLMSV